MTEIHDRSEGGPGGSVHDFARGRASTGVLPHQDPVRDGTR